MNDREQFEAWCKKEHINGWTDFDIWKAATEAARATPAQQQWISVKDRLPETYVYDDKPCRGLHGREIPPAIRSDRVLVALSDGAVCEDRLDGLQGHAPWWSTYRGSVIAWQPMPAAPSIAQDGQKSEGA